MLEILYQYFNKTRYWIIVGAVAVLYILGNRRGKETEHMKVMKGAVDNVKTAKRRNGFADSDRLKWLHNKYKR